jgi:hypothetical protein
MEEGTDEVALWSLQLYIVPFSKLPCSITGAHSIHFLIHLQPWDQDPTTYTTKFLGSRSHSWIAAGAEPDAHQFMSRFVYERGDRMEVNSKRYGSNSETRPGMHGQVRS